MGDAGFAGLPAGAVLSHFGGTTPIKLHVTDRHTFLRCRRQYYFAQVLRFTSRNPEDEANMLVFGRDLHTGLANYYRTGEAFASEEILNDQIKADDILLLKGMIGRYIEEYTDDPWKIIAVEVPVTITVKTASGVYVDLIHTLDLVVQDLDSEECFIVDHKGLKVMPSQKKLDVDDQITAYTWMAWKCGYDVRGCIYNVLKKKLPTIPEPLKRGGLSQNKMIDTTYQVYLRELERNDYDVRDYDDILNHLAEKPNNFFRRFLVRRNKKQLQAFEEDLKYQLDDIIKDPRYYKSTGMHCDWCQYNSLCVSWDRGEDTQSLLEVNYRTKEEYER